MPKRVVWLVGWPRRRALPTLTATRLACSCPRRCRRNPAQDWHTRPPASSGTGIPRVRPSVRPKRPPSKKGAAGRRAGYGRHGGAGGHAGRAVRAGHREPLATVAIKPRVDGQVIEVGFKEGDLVQAGSMLYRLDDRLVRAQIKQAEAQIAQGPGVPEGRRVDRRAARDAFPEEVRQRSVHRDGAAERRGAQGQHCGRTGAARDAAHSARLSHIRAPITGRTGSITAKLGAFMRSADPCRSSPSTRPSRSRSHSAASGRPTADLKARSRARLDAKITGTRRQTAGSDGKARLRRQPGRQDDRHCDWKVMVENADESLWPGLAVTVDLTVETRTDIVFGSRQRGPARSTGHDRLGPRRRRQGCRAARGPGPCDPADCVSRQWPESLVSAL